MDVVLGLLAALFWGGTDFLVGLNALLRLVGPALAGKASIAHRKLIVASTDLFPAEAGPPGDCVHL
jgi:hypothetical protein